MLGDEAGARRGQQDLTAVSDCAETGTAVYVLAAVIALRFACMDRHSDLDRCACGPLLAGQRELDSCCCANRLARSAKDGEEAVAFAAFGQDVPAVMRNQ